MGPLRARAPCPLFPCLVLRQSARVPMYGMYMGGGPQRSGPYGKGKGKGWKSKGGPPKEKPLVNTNHINPAKEPLDGGISFKNILQEKVSAQTKRPIGPGDMIYEVQRMKGGKACTLTIPCLNIEEKFQTDTPGKDDKQAGQI